MSGPRSLRLVEVSGEERAALEVLTRRTTAGPGQPVQVEHEYRRAGATHLFAAVDTRSGRVYGVTSRRKRQLDYLTLLEQLDRTLPPTITTIHLLADTVSVQHGTLVCHGLADHPRFVAHVTPVHCSWMHPVEPWVGILRRKRLRSHTFVDLPALHHAIHHFIAEWNDVAHPFRWTASSFDKVLAKVDAALASDTPPIADAA